MSGLFPDGWRRDRCGGRSIRASRKSPPRKATPTSKGANTF